MSELVANELGNDVLKRLGWAKMVIGVAFLIGICLSLRLWLDGRSYPLVPVFDFLPSLPFGLGYVLLCGIILSLIAVVVSSSPQRYIWITLSLLAVAVSLDQSRLQPWVYQYGLMLAALALFPWQNWAEENAILHICRLIVASIYFWSGLQKVNVQFFSDIFPWFVSPISSQFPLEFAPAFTILGFLVPLIEIFIGIGLVFRKTRNLAIIFSFGMAIFVLGTLGPFGHNWNSVVWPWNIAMPLLVLALFGRSTDHHSEIFAWTRNFRSLNVIFAILCALPFLYFFNHWDSYPSWALYSGNVGTGSLNIGISDWNNVPKQVQGYGYLNSEATYGVDIFSWSMGELNVPPYPEPRIFKGILRSLCLDGIYDISLTINPRLSWFNQRATTTLVCADVVRSNDYNRGSERNGSLLPFPSDRWFQGRSPYSIEISGAIKTSVTAIAMNETSQKPLMIA